MICLAEFDPRVNLIFPAVLFINGCTFRFKSVKCLYEREKPAFTKSCIFDNVTKERALDLNLG